IRYNAAVSGLKPSKDETVKWFKEYLAKNKISATVRKSLGQEIQAACGQLAGENTKTLGFASKHENTKTLKHRNNLAI
ncbi:hypothetical protein L6249_03925, partial [Candidatus Parcubacteria bacterium]|nr:hypothetical protein [Candidatus Parcubacteria bacterium]